jgi:hypothetical protein
MRLRSFNLIVVLLLLVCIPLFAHPQSEPTLLDAARKALPNDIATTAIVKALDAGVWNSNRTAVAISIPATSKSSILFVFLKSNSGQYKAVDVSGVEAANLGVIGISRNTDYARVATTPVAWLHRDDGRFQVVMRTRAWKAGQRYSVSENLLLAPDGTPLYR